MNVARVNLQSVLNRTFAGIGQGLDAFVPQLKPREVGTIVSVATGIAKVSGLPGVGFEELVTFPGDVLGIAFNVDEDEIGVVLLGAYQDLQAGDEVQRTGRVMDVAVGDELLGRVIDPLGRPLDGIGPVAFTQRLPIERQAAAIMDRSPVTVPLQTGLMVIDALIPIGRGQREKCDLRLLCHWPARFRCRQSRVESPRKGRDGLHRDRGRRRQRCARVDLYYALCRDEHCRILHGKRP